MILRTDFVIKKKKSLPKSFLTLTDSQKLQNSKRAAFRTLRGYRRSSFRIFAVKRQQLTV